MVWRCISRIDYGTKYCKESPSIEESVIQNAVCEAITKKAQMESVSIDRILGHIAMYQSRQDTSDILTKQERLKAIQSRISELTDMNSEAAQNGDYDELFEQLFAEMYTLKDELTEMDKARTKLDSQPEVMSEVAAVIEGLKNHPVEYDDLTVRQLIECIKVMSPSLLQIHFKDGAILKANI